MPILTLFVPAPGRSDAVGIDPGSAIVGHRPTTVDGRVLVYFEGNRYNADSLRRYDARVEVAAGRLLQRYPTIARAALDAADLIAVGVYDSDRRALDIHDASALALWVGEKVASGETADARRASEHQRAKEMGRRPRSRGRAHE